ncbi:MAG: hypothetical protein ACJ8LG_20905 [Massilia sp.]
MSLSSFLSLPLPVVLALGAVVLLLLLLGRLVAQWQQPVVVRAPEPAHQDAPEPQQG